MLQLGWYNVRVPLRDCHSLSERAGYLALRGSPHKLQVEHSPSILLRKQAGFDLDWSTQVEFTPSRPGQEAGAVLWLTGKLHVVVGVRGIEGGKTEIVYRAPGPDSKLAVGLWTHVFASCLRLTAGLKEKTFAMSAPAGSPVTLVIKARRLEYEFSFRVEGEDTFTSAGSIPTEVFVPMFTKVHLGLYAQGADEMPSLNSAFFKYAKWERAEG